MKDEQSAFEDGSGVGSGDGGRFRAGGEECDSAAVLTAKTIAVVNDTRDPKVQDGAVAALKNWGQFTVVDDPQLADITLRFDKTKEHSGSAVPPKTDADGKPLGDPSYGYSMNFGSKIHMKAYLKDGDDAFYTTQTDDGKAKAGTGCVNEFHTAFRGAKAAQP